MHIHEPTLSSLSQRRRHGNSPSPADKRRAENGMVQKSERPTPRELDRRFFAGANSHHIALRTKNSVFLAPQSAVVMIRSGGCDQCTSGTSGIEKKAYA